MVAIVCLSVFAVLFGTNKTYSSFVSVIVPDGDEVSVYVSGNDVEKDEKSKNYNVTPGSTITVTVVNESRLFKSISVNGGTPTYSPVLTVTVPDNGRVEITVETEEPYAEDKGKYFGNPYLLSKEADVLAVARILKNGVATAEDLAQIGAASTTTAEDIRYGYYRLATNLFISNSEFFGLGFRGGLPFGGCFDFDGYAATINLVRTSHAKDEFTLVGDKNYADYGFFGYAYGDGKRPCLMRNLKLQGFVGINTMQSGETVNHGDVVNVGGVAGVAGKNIVFDGIQSTVSVSVQTRFASLCVGGIFGICSSSVEAWCNVHYDGAFNDVSGVTYGENARAVVGGFAGVIHNASINGVTIDAEQSMVLANALGRVSGSAIAGGFAGIIELGASSAVAISDPRPLIIKNVVLYAEKDYSVSAVIDNSDSADKANITPDDITSSSAAIAGGIIGTVDRGRAGETTVDADCTIEFSDIFFERSRQNITGEDAVTEGSGRVSVTASTQDGGSSGAVFAGGAIGYIFSISANYIFDKTNDEKIKYYFDCSVDVSAVQNGTGPAYAGGAFGYNALRALSESGQTAVMKRGIVSPGNDYTVTAVQSATSSKTDNKFYNACAGGYSSRFSTGYQLKDMTFYVGSGRITAYREVGSTAVGDVNAGGLVGRVLGYGNASATINQYENSPSQSGSLENITIYYTGKSRIEASCYSFSSINASGNLGNNVCSGGAIGYVLGYSRINGLSVIFEEGSSSSGKEAEYFVSGVQNAKNNGGDAGLKSEGFVGGAFGLVIDTQISDVNVIGDAAEKSVVYFTSSNSPNTASVGGIVGTLSRRKIASGTTLLNGATVKNLHVAGRAYSESNRGDEYDLYSGGAIGVFAITDRNIKITIKNIDVSDCIIDSVGEKSMLTYSGGVVGGMWWTGNTVLYYATVRNCAVTASSISWNAYAGGIVGLMQSSDIAYCLTQNTEVKAISEQLNAYAAGIAARARAVSDSIKYAYSNASLKAQGKNGSNKYGIIAMMDVNDNTPKDSLDDATANFFVYETAGVRKAHPNDTDNTRALYLYNTQNAVSIAINQQPPVRVYSAIKTYQSSTMTIKSHSDAATISGDGLSVTGKKRGVAYVSAYCKIAYPAENGSAAVTKEFLLCSYPVTVDGYSESGAGLILKTDDGNAVTAEACDSLVSYNTGSANYVYFRRNVGNPDTLKKINVFPNGAEYLPQSLKFYDITTVAEAKYTDDINSRIKAIINAKGTSCDVSSFNGRASVGYNYSSEGDVGAAKKSVYFYANENARENTIVLMECTYGTLTYGVIVEFVPNKLESIEVSPESTTPPLGVSKDADGITHYIYSAGDVARFGATLHYHYPAPRSYVVETIYEGNGVTPNGTVNVAAGGYYTIDCSDIKGNKSTTFVVEAKTEVAFSFQYSGSTGSSDRKMVESSEFSFRTEPQPGYGLNPAVSITVNDVTALGTLSEGKITFDFNGKVFAFSAKRDSADGYSYAFVAGSDFVDYAAANDKSAVFSVEYKKIYSLVFIANYGGNDFFPVTVAAGEKFSSVTPDGFAAWLDGIKNNRYGYDFKGFYSVSKAGDVSAYGKSFEDMQKDGSAVSGTMRFYARWTYNITVDAPEGVNVTSSMPRSMLEENSNIVPLDANVGFGFVISAADGWSGKPRYNAFIRKENGTYEDITPLFTAASLENGYFISFEEIEKRGSGYIYLKIYADDLEFAVGDDPKYDGSSLYTDGIFTVTYNVNYGSDDKVKANAEFNFDRALPAGTSMRLFYRQNGVAAWAGSRVLTTAESNISVKSFTSMADGSLFADATRNAAVTEKFALVVTLPYNSDGFGLSGKTICGVTVDSYAYKTAKLDYGNYAPTLADTDAPDFSTAKSEERFTLLPAVIRSATYSGNKFRFIMTGQTDPAVVDHRHYGTHYMWRIDKTGGGYIGEETFNSFGSEVVRTTDAIYYFARVGEEVAVTENLSGYRVSLVEVRNVQQPAEGLNIFSKSF